MTHEKLAGLVSLTALLTACSGPAEDSVVTSESQPFVAKVADNVVVADAFTADTTEPFDDRLEMPAAGNERVLDLAPGTVFVGAPSESAPANADGFLRKVLRAYRQGDRIVVATAPAALTDTFVDVDLRAEGSELTTSATSAQSLDAPSLDPQARKSFKGISVDFAGKSLFDESRTLTTGAGAASVRARVYFSKGNLTLTPSVEADLKIRKLKVQRLLLAVEGQLSSEVELTAEVSSEGAFDVQAKKELVNKVWETRIPMFTSPTYRLPVQWIAGVPISIGVQFEVEAACSLRFEGAVSASAGAEITGLAKAQALYENGDWKPPFSAELAAKPSFRFTTKAGLTARCELDTASNLKVFGAGSAAVHVSPYLDLAVKGPELPASPAFSWGLYPGARGTLTGKLQPFGIEVASFERTLFDWRSAQPLVGSGP